LPLAVRLGRAPRAEVAFPARPYGFGFFDLLRHHSIWYYCDMDRTRGRLFGAMITLIRGGRLDVSSVVAQITVTAVRIARGFRYVAGTLLHELAHVNGAPGGDDATAERILLPFGLEDVFDPLILGQAPRTRGAGPAIAPA